MAKPVKKKVFTLSHTSDIPTAPCPLSLSASLSLPLSLPLSHFPSLYHFHSLTRSLSLPSTIHLPLIHSFSLPRPLYPPQHVHGLLQYEPYLHHMAHVFISHHLSLDHIAVHWHLEWTRMALASKLVLDVQESYDARNSGLKLGSSGLGFPEACHYCTSSGFSSQRLSWNSYASRPVTG